MTTKQQIELILDKLPISEAIRVIDKVSMKYRKASSIIQNTKQMSYRPKVDNERPDLMSMKP